MIVVVKTLILLVSSKSSEMVESTVRHEPTGLGRPVSHITSWRLHTVKAQWLKTSISGAVSDLFCPTCITEFLCQQGAQAALNVSPDLDATRW
jgi:hypothetical protein